MKTISPPSSLHGRRLAEAKALATMSGDDFASVEQMELWRAYRGVMLTPEGAQLADRLLAYHSQIIARWSRIFHQRSPSVWTYDDCFGYATAAALLAYQEYDPTCNSKLSSWVYGYIHRYMVQRENREGHMRIPGRKAMLCHYHRGRFDNFPKMREAIEKAHGLTNRQAVEDSQAEHAPLLDRIESLQQLAMPSYAAGNGSLTLEELVSDDRISSSDLLIERLDLEAARKSLSTKQNQALTLLVEYGMTLVEIAETMSRIHQQPISQPQVKSLLFTARRTLKQLVAVDDGV